MWPGNGDRFKNFSSAGFENSHTTTPNPAPGLISFCFHKWSALKWRLPKPPSQHSLPSKGGKTQRSKLKRAEKDQIWETNKLSPHYNPSSFSSFFYCSYYTAIHLLLKHDCTPWHAGYLCYKTWCKHLFWGLFFSNAATLTSLTPLRPFHYHWQPQNPKPFHPKFGDKTQFFTVVLAVIYVTVLKWCMQKSPSPSQIFIIFVLRCTNSVLCVPTNPSLHHICGLSPKMHKVCSLYLHKPQSSSYLWALS